MARLFLAVDHDQANGCNNGYVGAIGLVLKQAEALADDWTGTS